MKPSGSGELRPVPLVGQAPSYPADVVRRALELVQEHGAVYRAHRALTLEMASQGLVAPCWGTMWNWVQKEKDVITRIGASEKRNMVEMSQEVASAASERFLQAIPSLSDSQMPVAYGIAMQRRTDWENAGDKAPLTAIQIVLTDSKGQSIPEV